MTELSTGALAERVEAFERETLLAELKKHHHHMTNTAKALGLERSHLYKKCQQLGIDLRAIRSEKRKSRDPAENEPRAPQNRFSGLAAPGTTLFKTRCVGR